METKTLGTLCSETTNMLALKLWLHRVLMSTPSCQISTPHRLIVSEHGVPYVLVSQKWGAFYVTPFIVGVIQKLPEYMTTCGEIHYTVGKKL